MPASGAPSHSAQLVSAGAMSRRERQDEKDVYLHQQTVRQGEQEVYLHQQTVKPDEKQMSRRSMVRTGACHGNGIPS